jgi:Tol biopolymer transport system component
VDRSLVPCSAVAAALAALAALASGCGFGSPSASPDGQPPPPDPDAPSTDGGIDGPPAVSCLARWYDGTVAFEPPTQIAELAAPEMDRDPFLSRDELTLYFASYRSPAQNGDIFTATRSAIGSPFSAPQRDTGISSSATDSRFSMTSSELVAVLASDRNGTEGNSDIWIASRLLKTLPFGSFMQATGMPNINSPDNERDPELSADGLHLYLSAGSPQRIVVSSRSNLGGSFGSVQPLANLAGGSGDDADPALSSDERVIVFASTRGNGDGDLYYATRADKNAAFGTPARMPDVNVNSANEGDPFLSPDGCRLYFASDRAGSSNWELYVASMRTQQ